MSLSFVSKAVLTAKEGGDGYEEKEIESKDGDAGSSSRHTSSQPLFEQLRANKEKEEAEREEFQRSVMRGTLALDEEDCAHLDAIAKQRQEREQLIQKQTNDEVAAFRAARELRQLEQQQQEDDDEEVDEKQAEDSKAEPSAVTAGETKPAAKQPKFPQIIVKKKKRQQGGDDIKEPQSKMPKQGSEESGKNAAGGDTKQSTNEASNSSGGLGGLFADYGSDSD